mmetsp:Transcript_61460/g.143075  ORF Transcript_61460/g.143075 Transcript_61460/m.143075 type:complete len:84 (-) Transcript_61460:7-258(-)
MLSSRLANNNRWFNIPLDPLGDVVTSLHVLSQRWWLAPITTLHPAYRSQWQLAPMFSTSLGGRPLPYHSIALIKPASSSRNVP